MSHFPRNYDTLSWHLQDDFFLGSTVWVHVNQHPEQSCFIISLLSVYAFMLSRRQVQLLDCVNGTASFCHWKRHHSLKAINVQWNHEGSISLTAWLWWQPGFQMTQIHKCKSALPQDVKAAQSASQKSIVSNKGLFQIFLRFGKLPHQPRKEIKSVNGYNLSFLSFSLLGRYQWMTCGLFSTHHNGYKLLAIPPPQNLLSSCLLFHASLCLSCDTWNSRLSTPWRRWTTNTAC